MEELLIVTTGGTIDKIYFDDKSDYQVGDPQIGGILRELGVAFRFTVIPIAECVSLSGNPRVSHDLFHRLRIRQISTRFSLQLSISGSIVLRKIILQTGRQACWLVGLSRNHGERWASARRYIVLTMYAKQVPAN